MASPSHTTPFSAPLDDGEDLPRARFLNELAARELVHLGHDRFTGEVDPTTAAALGEAVLVRARADGSTLEAFVRLEGGVLLLLDYGHGTVWVEAAARKRRRVDAALKRLRGALAKPEPEETDVTFGFWACGPRGRGRVRHRDLEAGEWAGLRGNYAAATAAQLDLLMDVREPERGRLLLWHGAPGTGKTHALRALARAWRDWCSVECVLDPEALLSPDPNYLLDVLASDGEDGWRLIVLEDAGEQARLDAGRGSGMGQLLNLTDGLLGQGARALVLITTNEPAAAINPALRRPGRCLAEVEFAPLSAVEASRWLDAEVSRAHTLSELFALRDGLDATAPEGPANRSAFGFGRAILSEALKPDLERVISS
jgi:Domain of unknown function (DUF5925)/ATPase family associated with various cellular activities (AAA)